MSEVKTRIVRMFGGNGIVARLCGVTPGAVSQWDLIPAEHQQTLLNVGPEVGVKVRPEHFFDLPTHKVTLRPKKSKRS